MDSETRLRTSPEITIKHMVSAIGKKAAGTAALNALAALGLNVVSVEVLGTMNGNTENKRGLSEFKIHSVVTIVVLSPSDSRTRGIAEEYLTNKFGFVIVR